MDKFQVIVGNVGTVYSGNNYMVAMSEFSAYVKISKSNSSRCAGEPVTLMHNGEPKREYAGTVKP